MKAGTPFSIIFESIHRDPSEWIEPERFEPLRFDTKLPENKWLLNAEGKPRNPLAFTPHMGGKRICLGKTFSEMAVRHIIPLLFFYFDFALISNKRKPSYSIFGRRDI